MSKRDGLIYVVDMESSLGTSITRRVLDMVPYVHFHRWDMEVDYGRYFESVKQVLRGIVITGSSKNINSNKHVAPFLPPEIFQTGVPILAICYGLQYLCHVQDVPITRCWDEADPEKRTNGKAKKDKGEQGPVLFYRTDAHSELFWGLGPVFPVWMKHHFMAESLPPGWTLTGSTEKCPVAAIETGHIYGLQFHPEPYHSLFGKLILNNFFTRICGMNSPYF